jgi:hypothetical protein
MAKRKNKKKPSSCRKGLITISTRKGLVKFPGRWGKGCGPRKKPSTRHLAKYKTAMAKAARACKGRKGKSFRTCVANRM